MSVQSELTRIQNAKEAIRTAIIAKGVDVSSGATIDTYPTAIDSIGGGDEILRKFCRAAIAAGSTLSIPENITILGDNAFNLQKIYNIVIPDWITSMGKYAFAYNGNTGGLGDSYTNSLTIGTGLTIINEYAFQGRSIKNHVVIPDTIQEIKTGAFYDCTYISGITIGSGCTTIGDSVFYSAFASGTSVTLPATVTTLGTSVFSNSKISSCVWSSSITTIPNSTFANTKYLQSVTFNGTITSIGDSAFNGSGISSFTMPNSVTSLGIRTFAYTTGLTITLSTALVSTGQYMFEYSRNLNITIPSNIIRIAEYTFSKASGETIIFEEGCQEIKDYAFQGFSGGTITLPNSIQTIGPNAFYYCRSGLTSISIGSGCTSIGSYAFYYCPGLTSLTITAPTPPTLGSGAFSSTNNCIIYVPSGSVTAYQTATNWSSLSSRIQAIP